MSNVVSYPEPKKASGTGTPAGGEQWSEEDKAAYEAKWSLFARRMGNRPIKGTRNFRGVVKEIGPVQTVPNTYPGVPPGVMKQQRTLVCELTEPGLEGLRFHTDSADNARNDKTRLYALVVAVTKQVPPETGPFNLDLDSLCNVPVQLVIQKGKAREDGKRGGLQAKVAGFEALYEEEGEEEVPLTTAPLRRLVTAAQAAPQGAEEDVVTPALARRTVRTNPAYAGGSTVALTEEEADREVEDPWN